MSDDDDDIQEYASPCPHCDYHKKRAQLWRDEAYKQAGHPLPEPLPEMIRNDVLEEVAREFDSLRIAFGDTAASFAQYVREMK